MFFTSATRFARQAIQIIMMALGVWLVLTQQSSAGIMIATTILLGRALQPVEQLVASWRMLAEPDALWLGLAPITTAVIAPGFVKVDLNRRPVQHREGGIVRSVLVRDGQHVKTGEPVLMLGDVGVQADRERLDYRSSVLRSSVPRLEAEQLRSPGLRFADDLLAIGAADPRVREALKKEKDLFGARRATLVSEVALMQTQRERIEQECVSLRARIMQMEAVLALRRKTLELNRNLLDDGFISPTRIMQIEAETVDYAATLDQRASELARAAQRLGDVDLRIQASRNAYVQTAVTVDPASLHLAGDIALQAGMPAEVFIEGSTQTTLQYLREPLTSTARKALRQR